MLDSFINDFWKQTGICTSIKNELLLVVDGQPPIRIEIETTNSAFIKTGFKVIFHLLLFDNLINKPYKEIGAIAEVALGNINIFLSD